LNRDKGHRYYSKAQVILNSLSKVSEKDQVLSPTTALKYIPKHDRVSKNVFTFYKQGQVFDESSGKKAISREAQKRALERAKVHLRCKIDSLQ
jgi:hypothetical protein